MTKRLYLSDPYTTRFESRILRRLDEPEGPAVVLEETYFYPESGGQPCDLGTLDGIPVTGVVERGEEIIHILAHPPESERASCLIDRDRRHDHMQQHCGQHILSAAFLKKASSQTLAFHLGSVTSTIDLDRIIADLNLIDAAERLGNRVVRDSLPVRSYFIKSDEAARIKLRKAPEVEGILRIVDIEGFDRQACCGTHPVTTAEVGPIFIRGLEHLKKGTRVEFVCGDRALADYKQSTDRIRSLTRILSSSEDTLVEKATQLVEERKELIKSTQALREELLEKRAAEWPAEAESHPGFDLLVLEVSDVTPAELRLLVIFFTKEPSRVALLGTRTEDRGHLVFGRSANQPAADMAAVLREVLPLVEGKGGGSPHIAQGGGPRLEGVKEALTRARQLLLDASDA